MAGVKETERLVENIVRLRRAERVPAVRRDVSPVRRDLEARLGPTLSRSRAARLLGVSQTALDRWVAAGEVPTVVTPTGRRAVPCQFAIEVREAIDELRGGGPRRHALASALKERRAAAERSVAAALPPATVSPSTMPRGHGTAERRSLANHRLLAERLNERMVDEARERVERLAADRHIHPRYAERWRDLLSRSPTEVARAISADDEAGRDLRQNSPFAGMLNEQERRRIIETVR
ncbi:MAG TPA: hypothetical protein VF176_00390 [Solirubrobacterales bacterium]